jgi:glycosyltransferase involved in cell wall biosynthesis
MKSPLVSVIVTTKNSEQTLKNCLQSIQKQTYKDVEIIVIDNYSTDKTLKIAKQFTQLIFQIGPERSSQRNFGISKAKGIYLLFLDSDMYLSPQVISECVKLAKDLRIKGIYIPEKMEGTAYWIRVRNFERSFYNGTIIDAVRFVNSSTIKQIGGFDEKLFAGEDWDMDKRVRQKGRTAITNAWLFHNENNFSIETYIHKKAYYVPNLEKYRSKWKNDSEVSKQFSIMYRYIMVFIENGKWKKLISHLDLTFGMFFLRFLVGLTYLKNRHNDM